jgi:hypothetical protein
MLYFLIIMFIPEFKKMVEEESYLPDQALNIFMTGLSSSTCSLGLGIGEYEVSS